MNPRRRTGAASVRRSAVQRRNHCVQEGKRECGAGSTQERATWEVLLRHEHGRLLYPAVGCRIWNGALASTPENQVHEAVAIRFSLSQDAADRRLVSGVQFPPERVCQQTLDRGVHESFRLAQQELLQAVHAFDGRSRSQGSGGINRLALIVGSASGQ